MAESSKTCLQQLESALDNPPDEEALEKLLADVEIEAVSGSEAHQFVLGKYHYRLGEVKEGGEESSKHGEEAVTWLIKASKQGHEEATQLLAKCCEHKIGVTENNLKDVHNCLHTPKFEKQARQAAQRLFRTLNPLQNAEKLSPEQFKEGIDKLHLGKKERKMLEKAGKVNKEGDVTEKYFIEKLISNLHGYGKMKRVWEHDVEWEAYTSATWLQKMTKYPTMTISRLVDHAVEVTGREGMNWLKCLIPTRQIYMLMIFFIYSLLSLELILWFVPLFIFYTSITTMLVCTMQMFYTKRKTNDIKALGNMLQKFNDTLSSDSAESAYSLSSLGPYMVYFIALLTTVGSFQLANKLWIPCSEMTFIAGFFTVVCFLALSDKYDHLVLISILLDSISTLPSVLEGFPKIPILYHLLSFFFGAGFTIELLPDMYFQIGIPSLAYLIVPVLFIRMARQHSWEGTHRVLIPHLICFFWWRLAMLFLRHSTWLGLFRASIGWISFIIFLPFLIIIAVIWIVMYFSSVLTLTNMFKVITTIFLLAIPAGFALWAKTGFKIKGFKPDLNSSKIRAGLGMIFVLSILPMAFLFSPPERDVHGQYITWSQYRHICSKPHWDKTNMAETMMTCSQLTGIMVEWTGTVNKIVVKSMKNQAEGFIDQLPWVIANWLKCTYGEEYPECDTIEDEFERVTCQINRLQGRTCHMKNLNRYIFEIWLTMPLDDGGSHDIRIEASHWFKDALSKIKASDSIKIRASLQSEIGNKWPVLKLYNIQCMTCEEKVDYGSNILASKLLETYGLVHVKFCFQGLWNFFLAPIVEFYYQV